MAEYGLTEAQARCYHFIAGELARGECPSFDEIKDHMGLKSKSGVHRLVNALEERGKIIRLKHRARSFALPNEGGLSVADYYIAAIRDIGQQGVNLEVTERQALHSIIHLCKQFIARSEGEHD